MSDPSVLDQDILLGRWDHDANTFTTLFGADEDNANAVQVIARMSEERGNPVKLFFAPILGKNTTNISAKAIASVGTAKPWNVVIAQDITTSFVDEIDDARLADQALLDKGYFTT
jgi:hypothetical protein